MLVKLFQSEVWNTGVGGVRKRRGRGGGRGGRSVGGRREMQKREATEVGREQKKCC